MTPNPPHNPLPLFGFIHLCILVSVPLLGLALVWSARRWLAAWNPIRWSLALSGAGFGLTWYLFRYFALGSPLRYDLPLEICDVALWTTVAALVWPRQRLLELAYYWGFAGASMALLTPYLIAPLRSVPTITFLAGHSLILVGVIFLLGTGRLRPAPGSWFPALLALNALALCDFAVDRVLGVNYMYLITKPPTASALNAMGPWPWYICVSDVIAAALFLALQWPFRHPAPASDRSPQ